MALLFQYKFSHFDGYTVVILWLCRECLSLPLFFLFFFLFRKYTLKSLVVVGHYLLSIVQEKSSLYCTIPATFLLNCFKIKSIDTKKGKT